MSTYNGESTLEKKISALAIDYLTYFSLLSSG